MRPLSTGLVVVATSVAAVSVVANAFSIHHQFYPAVVHLTKSSASLSVIYVHSMVMVFLAFQLVRKLFFGELRASESEHLSERAWHALMETCLAFTVFREDFSAFFAAQFVLLLFIKCLHWLADDRVDLMERSPILTLKFHVRMLSVTTVLAMLDSFFVSHAYFSTITKGPTAQIVFGFEYAVLLTVVLQVVIKYVLHMIDLRSHTPWEAKSVYLLHAELVINVMRVCLYFLFVMAMMRVHTLPLFSIRPFYLSLRAAHKALNDVILSRRAVNAMNNRFPLVSAEELSSMDATCIICREEMTPTSSPKRLPCSHVFHAHCLRSWFQRQQTCPTCRTDILSDRGQRGGAAAAGAQPGAQGAPQPPNRILIGGNVAMAQQPNPNFFPFVAHQFAFHVPRQPENAGGGGGAAPAAAQPQGAVPVPPPVGVVPPPMGVPPMPPFNFPFPPPPGMPPIPPNINLTSAAPFPLPPRPSTAGLSDEELRALEGTTRAAVEARIRVLSDISSLLDAAVLQMQQYSSMVPAMVVPPSAPAPPPPAPSTVSPPTTVQPPQQSNGTTTVPPASSTAATAVTPVSNDVASTSTANGASADVVREEREAASGDDNQEHVRSESGPSVEQNSADSQEELRQRRLQRLAQ